MRLPFCSFYAKKVTTMKCPICNVGLKISDRSGVEIDSCPDCRGVWLDRGELDKILERDPMLSVPQGGQETRPRDRYDDKRDLRDRRSHYEKKKKRGGWLSELFDFGDD